MIQPSHHQPPLELLGEEAPHVVARCDDKLRSLGAKVPRGARASTRANVGGLTDREVEVLERLAAAQATKDIATQLLAKESLAEPEGEEQTGIKSC